MKRLMRAVPASEIGLVRGLLERAGIKCHTKNEQLAGALGDIPFLECEPELWVVHDEDLPRAEQILAAHNAPVGSATPWQCSHCDEMIDAQFEICWKCGNPDLEQ